MSMIEKILNRFGYEKTGRTETLKTSFDGARRGFFESLSDAWEDKVAGPARERQAQRERTRRSSSSHSSYDSGPSFFGFGGGDSGGSCGGGDGGGGGGGGE